MYLARLRLRDFRNYARLDAEFGPGFHVLTGDNAQGKTNLLEAIYLLGTLRSFRGSGSAQMVRQGQRGYFVGASLFGPESHELRVYWSRQERKVSLDGRTVKRLGDYFGTLRAVVFCTEDLQLVKGPSRLRRRYVDLLLAQTQPGYVSLLQRYMQAVRSRNALLRQRVVQEDALDGFSEQLVALGQQIMARRRDLIPRISPLVRLAYRRIAHGAEDVRLEYAPSVKSDFAVELAQARARDRAMRCTVVGPHRDDVALLMDDQPAAKFSSEGQKRTLAVALKTAQAEYLTGMHGSPPLLLIDDVMGELDAKRRAGLMPLLTQCHHGRGQAFMTCTEENWPRDLGLEIQRWSVSAGVLQRS